jgi:heat shock protein HslJ
MFKQLVVLVVLLCLGLMAVACGGGGPSPELTITEPFEKAYLDSSLPIAVSGTGAGLPEGNVVVQIVDQDGNMLAEEATTLQGPDVGAGGEGSWSVELTLAPIVAELGEITAFSPSPDGGEPLASASIGVGFGEIKLLEGTTWVLVDSIEGSEVTAVFEGGRVSGSAGCNTYEGAYEVVPAAYNSLMTISDLAVTEMACDEEIMAQEAQYLAGLQEATSYTVKQNILLITLPGGTLDYYDQTGSPPSP